MAPSRSEETGHDECRKAGFNVTYERAGACQPTRSRDRASRNRHHKQTGGGPVPATLMSPTCNRWGGFRRRCTPSRRPAQALEHVGPVLAGLNLPYALHCPRIQQNQCRIENCSFSVDPSNATVELRPPCTICVISSK